MSADDTGRNDQPADHAEAETDVSRRQALGRLATYTAPVMLAVLVRGHRRKWKNLKPA
jgi:hypothetical protein